MMCSLKTMRYMILMESFGPNYQMIIAMVFYKYIITLYL
jgi:hypothetical protein